jgi:hypothetical protein
MTKLWNGTALATTSQVILEMYLAILVSILIDSVPLCFLLPQARSKTESDFEAQKFFSSLAKCQFDFIYGSTDNYTCGACESLLESQLLIIVHPVERRFFFCPLVSLMLYTGNLEWCIYETLLKIQQKKQNRIQSREKI